MNPDMYMQYKNSGALNKPSLSQKLAETVVVPTEDQNNDSDDDFIDLDSNSTVDKPKLKQGVKTYFTQQKTEKYTKQDGSTGQRTYFACNIEVDGKPCSRGKDNPISQVGHGKTGGSTGKLAAHIRNKHPVQYEIVSSDNNLFKHKVVSGVAVRVVYTYAEATPHHERFVKLCAAEFRPFKMGEGSRFREFVSGLDIKYVPPHKSTCKKILKKMKRIIETKLKKIINKAREKLGGKFCGLQTDLWSAPGVDSESFSCLTISIVDIESGGVISEVIGFQKFDVNSHTGENIRKWIIKILKRYELTSDDVMLMTADGASNNVKALAHTDYDFQICIDHGLQNALKAALGFTKSQPNQQFQALIQQHKKVTAVSSRSTKFARSLKAAQRNIGTKGGKELMLIKYSNTR